MNASPSAFEALASSHGRPGHITVSVPKLRNPLRHEFFVTCFALDNPLPMIFTATFDLVYRAHALTFPTLLSSILGNHPFLYLGFFLCILKNHCPGRWSELDLTFQGGVKLFHYIAGNDFVFRKSFYHHELCTTTSATSYICLTRSKTSIQIDAKKIDGHPLAT